MKNKIYNFIKKLHLNFLGYEISDNLINFLKNLSFSMSGFFISSSILLATNILAGRLLGPTEYGKYSYLIMITGIISVLIFMGNDASSVKFLSIIKKQEERDKIFSYFLTSMIFMSIFIIILITIFHNPLSHILKIPKEIIILAPLLATINSFKILYENLVRCKQKFYLQAKAKVIESIVVLILFLLFSIIFNKLTYKYYLLAILIGGTTVILSYSRELINFKLSLSKRLIKKIFPYQKLSIMVSIISIIMISLDKIIVVKFLGIKEFGIYSAYLMASVLITGQITSALVNVFFPTVNLIDDKIGVISKIDRIMTIIFLPFIILLSTATFIILKLFGNAYIIHPTYILIVALISFFQILVGFYGAVISSHHEYFKINTKIYMIKPVVIILLYFVLYKLNFINIISVLMVLLTVYLFDIINTKISIRLSE